MKRIVLMAVFLCIIQIAFAQEKLKDGVFNDYYDSVSLKEEVIYNNAEKHGPFKKYYENGSLYSEGVYVNGKLYGIVKYYYDNGQLHKEVEYLDGKRNGVEKTYTNPNQGIGTESYLYSEIGYKDNKYHGVYKTYYPNGQIIVEKQIVNQKEEGELKEYYQDGSLKQKSIVKNGRPVEEKNFDESGNLLPSGFRDGMYWQYDVSGKLKLTHEPVYNSKDGIMGIYRYYYPNEKIKLEIPITKGGSELGFCVHGLMKIYFEDGQLKDEVRFRDCKEDGGVQRFYNNGQLREKGVYKEGEWLKVKRFNRKGEELAKGPTIHIEFDKGKYISGDIVTIYIDNNLNSHVRLAWLFICAEGDSDWDCKSKNSDISGSTIDKGETMIVELKADELTPGKGKFRVSYATDGEYPFFESQEFIFTK